MAQVVTDVPAFTTGAGFIVKVLLEVALPHGELPVAVNVKLTVPAAMSAAPGV